MNKLEGKLNNTLNEIYELINKNIQDEACVKYYNLILELERLQFEEIDRLYYESAILLFNNYYYEECVLFLSKAYSGMYKKREIKEFIFDNFIEPNRKEFFESLKKNMEEYNKMLPHFIMKNVAYEDLPLEFIPVSKDKYFIFDLELDNFNEIIDFSEKELTNTSAYKNKDEYSDILIIDDFNLDNAKKYIKSIENRNIYYYSLNELKTLSFFKLPYIIEKYLKNIIILSSLNTMQEYFRKNLDIYLPRIIHTLNYKNSRNIRKKIKKLLDYEHEFRLTTEGRDTKNILLSICIPTWNRGNLALDSINNLLKLPYDSEIEFVISDNGSTKYIEEYKKIKYLNDSRINYFRFNENKGGMVNFANVVKIANGKFTLLLSDEDTIILDSLPHYMSILKRNPKVGLIRSATNDNYKNLENNHFFAGYDALKNFFLRNNYISGVIYNRKIFNEYNLNNFVLDNNDNVACIFYPHMCWDSIVALHGDVITDNITLVAEGKSVLQEQIEKGIEENDKYIKSNICSELNNIPIYQTYESRIEQHYGFIELINSLDIESVEVIVYLYIMLCNKTNFLISFVTYVYEENGYDLNFIYDEILECCLNGIDNLKIKLSNGYKELIKEYSMKYNTILRNR